MKVANPSPPVVPFDVGALANLSHAGAVAVAGYAQVSRIAQIDAEFHRVVADGLGPVVDQLELVFFFLQRAVAVVHLQTGAKLRAGVLRVVVGKEAQRADRGHVGDIDIRRSEVSGDRLVRGRPVYVLAEEGQVGVSRVVFVGDDVVAEVA